MLSHYIVYQSIVYFALVYTVVSTLQVPIVLCTHASACEALFWFPLGYMLLACMHGTWLGKNQFVFTGIRTENYCTKFGKNFHSDEVNIVWSRPTSYES